MRDEQSSSDGQTIQTSDWKSWGFPFRLNRRIRKERIGRFALLPLHKDKKTRLSGKMESLVFLCLYKGKNLKVTQKARMQHVSLSGERGGPTHVGGK